MYFQESYVSVVIRDCNAICRIYAINTQRQIQSRAHGDTENKVRKSLKLLDTY